MDGGVNRKNDDEEEWVSIVSLIFAYTIQEEKQKNKKNNKTTKQQKYSLIEQSTPK